MAIFPSYNTGLGMPQYISFYDYEWPLTAQSVPPPILDPHMDLIGPSPHHHNSSRLHPAGGLVHWSFFCPKNQLGPKWSGLSLYTWRIIPGLL